MMVGKKPTTTRDLADLALRKLRAKTRRAEQEEALRLPLFWMDWLKTIAILGAAMATLVKVLLGA